MRSTTNILHTKLHKPAIPSDYVPRVNLLRQLDQGLQRYLTLVTAPAGYGKSTLVSSWLKNGDFPSAWLSLDDSDNDLREFLIYFLAAVETLFPGATRKTRTLVEANTLPPLSQLAVSLINELDGIQQHFVLVLDDIHRIHEHPVYDLLIELIRHFPQSLHLVLAGRSDPPLPISVLRAQDRVNEIRARELCFTSEETMQFLQHSLGMDVDTVTAAAWQDKTEGWAAGLRLATLAIKRSPDLISRLPGREWGAQQVRDFLFNEVLSHQPPDIRRRLLNIAILERFCAPLCDAIEAPNQELDPGKINSWDFISWLNRENIFTIALDTDNRWFRFHHLFRQLLQNQLERHISSEDINSLHVRASGWFAEENLIEEALYHALAAGKLQMAGNLVARFAPRMMNDEQWIRLENCLHLLPQQPVERDPALLVLQAWLYHIRFNFSGVSACVEKIETLNATTSTDSLVNTRQVPGHLEILKAILHYMSGDGDSTLTFSQRALKDIPLPHKRARLFADAFQLGGYQMSGNFKTGLQIYQKAMDRYIDRDTKYHAMYLANLGLVYWIDADLKALQQTAECLLDLVKEHPLPALTSWGHYLLGTVHFHRNELQDAEQKLTQVFNVSLADSPMNFAHSGFALALTYQAQGKLDQAKEITESVLHNLIETNNTDMLKVARAFEAELAFLQGCSTITYGWVENYHGKPFRPVFRFYMPQLTAVKIFLAKNTKDSRRQAADLLRQLYDFLVSIHNKRFQIEVLALHALLHDTEGENLEGLKKLSQALALAEPGGFIRTFVDLGPKMAELLRRLIRQGEERRDYIGHILAAFRENELALTPTGPDTQTVSSTTVKISDSDGFLTEREFEILALLEQPLRNCEIAEQLFVSRETVKTHLHHIYKKLNASNRMDAVSKAHALGILPHL